MTPRQVWIPDLEVMNRIHDFPLTDEKLPKLSVNHHGRVWLKRYFRMRVRFKPEIENYPYDKQTPELVIASADKDEDIQLVVIYSHLSQYILLLLNLK